MGTAEVLVGAWCGLAIAWDARARRIPNTLTFGAATASGVCFALAGQGPLGGPWLASLMAGGAVGAAASLMFAVGWLGAGDAKFMAALPLVGGPARAMIAFALGWALLFVWLVATYAPGFARAVARHPQLGSREVPLAVPFGLGFLASLFLTSFRGAA